MIGQPTLPDPREEPRGARKALRTLLDIGTLGGSAGFRAGRNQAQDTRSLGEFLGAGGDLKQAENFAIQRNLVDPVQALNVRQQRGEAQADEFDQRLVNLAGYADSLTPEAQAGFVQNVVPALVEAGLIDQEDLPAIQQAAGQPGGFSALVGVNTSPQQATENDLDAFNAGTSRINADASSLNARVNAGFVGGGASGQGPVAPTVGTETLDREAAKDIAARLNGGRDNEVANLTRLERVSGDLRSGRDNLTGPIVSRLPDALRPQGIQARETVETVVQQSLREILGGQFAQQEARELIRRFYNERLDEGLVADRVDILKEQLTLSLEEKDRRDRYFRENGTLRGFTPRPVSIADIEDALSGATGGQSRAPDLSSMSDAELEAIAGQGQ